MKKPAVDQQVLDEYRGRLRRLLAKIPSDQGSWSYDRSHSFKAAHHKAAGVVEKQRATVEAIKDALVGLNHYFRPEEAE